MKPTIEQIEKIIADKENEQRRVNLCLSEKICPECGGSLTKTIKYTTFLFLFNGDTFEIKSCNTCNFTHKREIYPQYGYYY